MRILTRILDAIVNTIASAYFDDLEWKIFFVWFPVNFASPLWFWDLKWQSPRFIIANKNETIFGMIQQP